MKKSNIFLILSLFLLFIPRLGIHSQINIQKELNDLPPYNKEIQLLEKSLLKPKEKRKYYLVCVDYECTKQDTIFAKEYTMILQDSLSIPIYQVSNYEKANCVLYLKNKN